MRPEDIGYIAGLMDGEGSLNTTRLIDKRIGRVTQGCRINITAVSNSNPLVLAHTERILHSWGITFVKRQTHPRFWAIDIKGRIDNKRKFLEIIFNSLVGKKEQARLLLQFMQNRGAGKRVLITEEDRYLLDQVRVLNHLNYLGSVETAREAGSSLKIQSDLGSDAERLAEMPSPKQKLA